jgi:valyl-tRNA synthetase
MTRSGLDSPFDETQMKVGRRLALKILNAARFVLDDEFGVGARSLDLTSVTEPIDLALLSDLTEVVAKATEAFEAYDYTTALETAEKFFWSFCDDYLELVKERAYNREGTIDAAAQASAKAALAQTLHTLLRLLAPFLPYATEEVWSWWQDGSVHLAAWPTVDELPTATTGVPVLAGVSAALAGIRGAKSTAKVSQRTKVTSAVISGPSALLAGARIAEADLRRSGTIDGTIEYNETEANEVTVAAELELAD